MGLGHIPLGLTGRGGVERAKNLHRLVIARLGFEDALEALRCVFWITTIDVCLAEAEVRKHEVGRRKLCGLQRPKSFKKRSLIYDFFQTSAREWR